MTACPRCAAPNPDGARFCNNCGLPLEAEEREVREGRRTVTIVFCDVTGSTALGEHFDPESLRRVMSRFFAEVRAVLARHGGTVEKFIGDAVVAVFGIPELHEDDALRAVRAALEMRAALDDLNEELERSWGVRLQVRTGVNTGAVVAGSPESGQAFVTGDPVNVAARLEQVAAPGEILVGPATYRLVRDAVCTEPLGSLVLRGRDEPVRAYRLLDVVPGAPGHARRLDAPLVGREQEIRLIDWAFSRAVRERTCHLFTVLGPAGVGKSRLVAEAVERLGDDALVLGGTCPPYGEGVTYWPVSEALRRATGIDPRDRPAVLELLTSVLEGEENAPLVTQRLLQLLGHPEGETPSVDESAWSVRRMLEALARTRPVVVVLDDLHWAEPTFLDLVEHVADWTRDAPMLVLCVARPDILDTRPSWGGGKLNATSLLLEPLTDPESAMLLGNLLPAGELDDEVRARISAAAEGNPLFVEEMLAMVVDDGLIELQDGHWRPTVDLASMAVPPTIQALLASRLDRLNPDEARLLERASVAGKVFERDAVVALSPEAERQSVGSRLLALARQDLVRRERSAVGTEDAYSFRHVLMRDAAYESLPKHERAELHERFATWLGQTEDARAVEIDELIGFHLEAAVRNYSELGPLDPGGVALAERAAERLCVAGRRALAREDVAAAAHLLERAVDLLDEPATTVLVDLAAARTGTGDLSLAQAAFERAAHTAAAAGDERAQAEIRLRRLRLSLQTDPGADLGQGEAEATALVRRFEEAGDVRGQAEAWALVSDVNWSRSQVAASRAASERSMVFAREAGARDLEADQRGTLASFDLFGPTPVEEGIRYCEEVLETVGDRRSLEARLLRAMAGMRAMQGDFGAARELMARCRSVFEDLGLGFQIAGALQVEGSVIEHLAGDHEAAERAQRRSYELLRVQGSTSFMSTAAAMLALALDALGRYEEAEELSRVSEEAAAGYDLDSQMGWRTARARSLAARGRVEEAVGLGREAAALARQTDLIGAVEVTLEVGILLGQAGLGDEARPLLEYALDAFRRKGNVVSSARARAGLDALALTSADR